MKHGHTNLKIAALGLKVEKEGKIENEQKGESEEKNRKEETSEI
jgi:hypothetical protein